MFLKNITLYLLAPLQLFELSLVSDTLLPFKILLQLEPLLPCSFLLSQQFLSSAMSLLIILSDLAPSLEFVLGLPLL